MAPGFSSSSVYSPVRATIMAFASASSAALDWSILAAAAILAQSLSFSFEASGSPVVHALVADVR